MGGQGTAAGGGQPRLFYGWYIVAVALLANFMSTGTTFYIFNAFMLPLCQAHGWTRAQINAAPMLGFVFGLMGQFAYGSLLLRVGPRSLMTVGPVVSCLAFVLLGRVESIGAFYALFVLLYLGNGAMNGIVANTAVSNWFEHKRGQALGMATAGMSVSGVLLPYLALVLMERYQLSGAFLVVGLMILAVSPLAWLVVRTSPESCGLRPDGLPRVTWGEHPPNLAGYEHAEAEARQWSSGQTMRQGVFWRLGAAYALAMMGAVGVMFQLAPRFQDLGFTSSAAILLTAAVALLGTAGKFVWGLFCDWWEPRRVVAVLIVSKAVGLALGLDHGHAWVLVLFILVFGFAMGGVISTFPVMAAHIFGRRSFPVVYRLLVLFLALQGLGYLVMGQSYDLAGSYDPAFVCFLVLDLAAAGLILSLKRPSPPAGPQRERTWRRLP